MGGDISYCFTTSNDSYLSRHLEIERFDMPETFYFRYLPDRLTVHWAIIKPADEFVNVYFINSWGRVFDKLEFKNIKIARRRLRKCGFDFSTNRRCQHTPCKPIYVQLSNGKKSAPYSKGNLFKSVQRDRNCPEKAKISFYKGLNTIDKKCQKSRKRQQIQHKPKKIKTLIINNKKNSLKNDLEYFAMVIFIIFIITFILTTIAGW